MKASVQQKATGYFSSTSIWTHKGSVFASVLRKKVLNAWMFGIFHLHSTLYIALHQNRYCTGRAGKKCCNHMALGEAVNASET